jgi:hypothetical protein
LSGLKVFIKFLFYRGDSVTKKDILEQLRVLWTNWEDGADWEASCISGNIQYGEGLQKCADDLKELLILLKVFNE